MIGRRLVTRAALLAPLLTSLAGCTSNAFTRLGMPKPITSQGKITLTLWQGSWVAAWAVGAVVWGLIIWTVIFYRKRSDELPPQVRYNLPIEVLYTVVPFIMVAALFYFTARDENSIDALSPHPNVVVNVTGFQWSWEFQYPDLGNVQIIGTPTRDPTLVLPVGETVRFNLTSPDVIHSFWVPAFLFKRDVVPGHPNHFDITTTAMGTFRGECSELCGLYHSEMLFSVKVVSQQQFQQFISAQQAAQQAAAGSVQ
ncbi:MAG TPA: cytochrome c oxidase subunit II [Streptosporangiaceae bacterium]|nr:cytochrome c oxidase subunit II [Streptosporangiaceae bacterium]